MKPTTLAALCLATSLVTSLSGHTAHAERFELGMGGGGSLTTTDSMHALDDSGLGIFTMHGAVHLVSTAGVDILIDGAFESGTSAGTTFQSMSTETGVLLGLVGARARYHLSNHVAVHGRAAVGLGSVSIEILDPASRTPPLADRALGGSAYVGAGVDFLPIRRLRPDGRERMAFGLRAELGYLAMTPAELVSTHADEGNGDAIEIPTRATSLGQLDASALGLRVTFLGRF